MNYLQEYALKVPASSIFEKLRKFEISVDQPEMAIEIFVKFSIFNRLAQKEENLHWFHI